MSELFRETWNAISHIPQLRECSKLIANPTIPLSSYESAVIKQEESISWKLWLGSFGTYIGFHQVLRRAKLFRHRPIVPQFIAIVPALAVILAGGALFRQRTLDRLINQPDAARKDATLINVIAPIYLNE